MPYGIVAADVIQSSVSGVSLGAGNASIMKNRIINGAMVIDQRNAGASVTGATGFTLDRWETPASGGPVWNVQQVSDAPAGYTNSVKATVTTGSSASGGYSFFRQQVEGYNWADIGYGTANALTTTLSFWVKSSITGTYGLSFRNTSSGRFYTTTYTISSANTWEQKSVTITGDTLGTWNTTNGSGFQLFWDTGCGSTFSSVSNNAWSTVASNYFGVTGVTKLSQTTGATFQLTGVQLEVGTSATGFEYRQYGQELDLCKRYFLIGGSGGAGRWTSATVPEFGVTFPVEMRSAPTVSLYANFSVVESGIATRTATAITLSGASNSKGCILQATSSGATTGSIAIVRDSGIAFSSEL